MDIYRNKDCTEGLPSVVLAYFAKNTIWPVHSFINHIFVFSFIHFFIMKYNIDEDNIRS